MVANTENNAEIDNRDKNFLNQINKDMEKLQNKDIWFWKDKLLSVWVLICIIGSLIISLVVSTLIFTLFINSRELKTETQCVPLEVKSSKRLLSNNNISEASLVKIVSQTKSTTTILAPCNFYLYDELILIKLMVLMN
jgi:hypothetical protein